MTVYRRLGSRDDLVRAVVSREVGNLLAELSTMPDRHDDLPALVADVFVTVITRWRAHPLIERLLAVEPDRILVNLTVEGATSFAMSVAATIQILAQAAAKGLFEAPPDLAARTEICCRVVHSMILVEGGTVTLETPDELAQFARSYLVPILAG